MRRPRQETPLKTFWTLVADYDMDVCVLRYRVDIAHFNSRKIMFRKTNDDRWEAYHSMEGTNDPMKVGVDFDTSTTCEFLRRTLQSPSILHPHVNE